MSFLRAAVQRVVGLFVADWVQSAVVVAIVAAAWFTVSRFGSMVIVVFVLLLAGQMVWFAVAASRRAR